jgi:hypothetical protein
VLQVGNFCSRSSCRDGPARRSVNQPSTDKSIFYRFPKAGQHRKQSERIAAGLYFMASRGAHRVLGSRVERPAKALLRQVPRIANILRGRQGIAPASRGGEQQVRERETMRKLLLSSIIAAAAMLSPAMAEEDQYHCAWDAVTGAPGCEHYDQNKPSDEQADPRTLSDGDLIGRYSRSSARRFFRWVVEQTGDLGSPQGRKWMLEYDVNIKPDLNKEWNQLPLSSKRRQELVTAIENAESDRWLKNEMPTVVNNVESDGRLIDLYIDKQTDELDRAIEEHELEGWPEAAIRKLIAERRNYEEETRTIYRRQDYQPGPALDDKTRDHLWQKILEDDKKQSDRQEYTEEQWEQLERWRIRLQR